MDIGRPNARGKEQYLVRKEVHGAEEERQRVGEGLRGYTRGGGDKSVHGSKRRGRPAPMQTKEQVNTRQGAALRLVHLLKPFIMSLSPTCKMPSIGLKARPAKGDSVCSLLYLW